MLKIVNPATEAVIRELEEDTATSVADKYRRAKAAQFVVLLVGCRGQNIRIPVVPQYLNRELSNRRRAAPDQNWSISMQRHVVFRLWPRQLDTQVCRKSMEHSDEVVGKRNRFFQPEPFRKLVSCQRPSTTSIKQANIPCQAATPRP